MLKQIILSILSAATLSHNAIASVNVLFHPHDPTLQAIAQVFHESKASAQLVLYNIDVTDQSPLVQYLKSPAFQRKLKSGYQLQMIFEGYATPEENFKKMQALENLGIDVRFLGMTQKVHHKFAIFDAGIASERLITGSANWSLSSMNNYDENILFIENEKGIQSQFLNEFNLIWSYAEEFGKTLFPQVRQIPLAKLRGDLHGFFNSQNYNWSPNQKSQASKQIPHLTKTVVAAIDIAKASIEVATTRIKLAPVHAALVRAAKRGVRIRIVVSQAEYVSSKGRQNQGLRNCGDDLYNPRCSSGVNFSPMLDPMASGFENMELRLKFFNLNLAENIGQQMHNKYVIIDGRWVLTGSFNWSNSSEWQHLENIVVIDGNAHTDALQKFRNNFYRIWNMNRSKASLILQETKSCSIKPTSLTFQEIDGLRSQAYAQGICTNQ